MIRLFFCAAALAAPMAAAQQPAVTIAPAVDGNVLRAGAKVPVRTLVELTTKKKAVKVGDRVNIETAEAVMVGNNVAIPAGTPGIAEITSVRNKGMWGKSGFIEGRVLYVRLGGRQVRLTGTFNDKGVTGTAGRLAADAARRWRQRCTKPIRPPRAKCSSAMKIATEITSMNSL